MFYWTSFKNNFFFIHSFSIFFSFNPCFIGLHSKTTVELVIFARILTCFNPCFIGLHSKTTLCHFPSFVRNVFQSLFYWTSFKNLKPKVTACIIRRFNPCFIGLHSKTAVEAQKSLCVTCFNPCFIGLHSKTNRQSYQPLELYPLFQSLFYWTSFKNSDNSTSFNCDFGFQSLFYWTSFKNHQLIFFQFYPKLVSILVLLDFIQKQLQQIISSAFGAVSILVLLDFIQKLVSGLIPRRSRKVSILVLLDFIQKHEIIPKSMQGACGFNPCFIGLHSKTLPIS